MCRFSLGVAALALAASGAFAQGTGPPGTDRAPTQNAEQRGEFSLRAGNPGTGRGQRGKTAGSKASPPPAIDLRPANGLERTARRAVGELLTEPDRREAGDPPPPLTDRPEPPALGKAKPGNLPSRKTPSVADARTIESSVWGPLDRSARLLANCPPGLAKTDGCEPSGKARSRRSEGMLDSAVSPLLFGLSGFAAGPYLYNDGYLVRLAGDATTGDAIAGYIPLLGGALAAGNIWPDSYGSKTVPPYLVDFFNLGQPGSYRYADNTLYRVDPRSGTIQSIAALLTDDEIEVGEPMPPGYDIYNVPAPLCERYPDSARALYRYADGYVYRIDPETRLVAAAIDLLT